MHQDAAHTARPIAWRLAQQVTQEELARLLTVDLRTVQRWESGESAPRRATWPQLDAFDRGDLILVRTPTGDVLLSPAADHLAWRQIGATIRRAGVPATPAERVAAAIEALSTVEELRAAIDALDRRAREIDAARVAAPQDGLTVSRAEITVVPEVATESSAAVNQSQPQTPARRGPGRPRLAESMTTRNVQLPPEHEAAVADLTERGLSVSAAVRVLIGRAIGERWAEDPDAS